MPYESRLLSKEELEKALIQRRERGYPLHAPPHPFRQSGEYFITASTYQHSPIIAVRDRCTELENLILSAFKDIEVKVMGWVILSTHYHLLLRVSSLDLVSNMLKKIHGSTSREWNLQDGMTKKRRVWYRFTDRMIRNEDHRYRALNYIHFNPVKHNLVKDPYDWPWTSLHSYSESEGREWLRRLWTQHPPGYFGEGSDDND